MISENDEAALRGLVGDGPSDGDLEDRYDRLGNIYLVAREVLSEQLASFISSPASFSVAGYSENNAANMTAVQKQLDHLDKIIDGLALGPVSVSSVTLSRPDRLRR